MRVLIYEDLSGGGLYGADGVRDGRFFAWLLEGAAMAAAVAEDFRQVSGIEVIGLRDAAARDLPPQLDEFAPVAAFDEREAKFDELALTSDFVLLIAPETGNRLFDLARRVERLGTPLLSPSSAFIAWAADKHRTCETLRAAGVSAPRGEMLRDDEAWPARFPVPAVLKPNDGCGSEGIAILHEPSLPESSRGNRRLEEFVTGIDAGVGVLRGSAGVFVLQPCKQEIDPKRLSYFGGSCPLASPYAERASQLALRAAWAMPDWIGYIGIDMVLGSAADGSQDFVIEVNPRLTTSYVGVRTLAQHNLAQAMLDAAAGRRPSISFSTNRVCFTKDGAITPC